MKAKEILFTTGIAIWLAGLLSAAAFFPSHAMLTGLSLGIAHAQEIDVQQPAFAQPEQMAAKINNDSLGSLGKIEHAVNATCPDNAQVVLDAIELEFLPPPTDAEKRASLQAARTNLIAAGLDAKSTARVAVDAELDKVPVAMEASPVGPQSRLTIYGTGNIVCDEMLEIAAGTGDVVCDKDTLEIVGAGGWALAPAGSEICRVSDSGEVTWTYDATL